MRNIENKDNEMNPDFQSKFQNMSFSEKRTYVQEILKDVFNALKRAFNAIIIMWIILIVQKA